MVKNMLLIKFSNTVDKALCVIAGAYGNGKERKEKLGEDYEKVQACVNDLLKVFDKYK